MYKCNSIGVLRRKVGVERVFDKLAASEYAVNVSGFLRSDFSTLSESQDALAMSRVLQRMQELTNESPDNKNKSFDEIVKMVKPRWCQLPAEMDRFEQYCIENAIDFYKQFKENVNTTADSVSAEPPAEVSASVKAD